MEANFSVCVGLYNDEESRDMKNYNNVVYNNQPYPGLGGDFSSSNQPWGLSLGGATYNNMFVDNHCDGTLPTTVYYESNDSAWEKNIAVNTGKSINAAKGKHDKWTGVDIGHNLFWNEDDDNYTMAGGKYAERDIKMLHNYSWDQHSLFGVDPLYHDKENGDLRFRYTSPAYRLGFRDVDMSDIGLTEEFTIAKGEVPNAMYIRIVDRDTNGYVDLTSGESADLAVVLRDEEGYRVDPDRVTFTTDNPAIATVDATGRITAVSPGVARVNATAVKGDKTFVRPVDVLVEDEIATLNADLSLDPIRIGEHSTVRTWYLTKYGKHVPTGKITYTSADTSVATVDENGFVSGIGEGKTQIIVSDGNLTSTVDIEVRQSMFQSVELALGVNPVQVGQTSDLKISILNELGVEMEAPDSAVTVTTANEDVLSLEKKSTTEYVLNPIKEGSANVDVTVKLDGKTVKKTASVFVLNPDDEIDDTWLLANFGVNVDAALTPTRGSFKAYKGGFFEFSSDGYNFWNNQDQGTVAYKKIKLDPANPVAEVKLKFNATSLDDYNKEAAGLNMSAFGVIVRTNETAGSPSVHYRWEYGGGKVLYANRDTQDAGCGWGSGDSSETEPELRIIYDNGKVSMYYKANATKGWVLFKSMALKPEGDEIIIGIAGYSQNLDKDGKPLFMSALGNVEINSGADVDQSDTDYDIGNATLN